MDEIKTLLDNLPTFLDDCAAVGDHAKLQHVHQCLNMLSRVCLYRALAIEARLCGGVESAIMFEQLSTRDLHAAMADFAIAESTPSPKKSDDV